MKTLLIVIIISSSVLLAVCGCGNSYYEEHHVKNSMIIWSAAGEASGDELSDAVRHAMNDAPGATGAIENYPTFYSAILWHDSDGTTHKLSMSYDLGNGTAKETGIYFTATYFARVGSHEASAIDSDARGRVLLLLDDIQRRLGSHAMKSVLGVVVR